MYVTSHLDVICHSGLKILLMIYYRKKKPIWYLRVRSIQHHRVKLRILIFRSLPFDHLVLKRGDKFIKGKIRPWNILWLCGNRRLYWIIAAVKRKRPSGSSENWLYIPLGIFGNGAVAGGQSWVSMSRNVYLCQFFQRINPTWLFNFNTGRR